MKKEIFARKQEVKILSGLLKSPKSEFLLVYGRRRVGKTYLIREFFENSRCDFFSVTGIQKGNMQRQLGNFTKSFSKLFHGGVALQEKTSWMDAFDSLTEKIKASPSNKPFVIFLDELPWLSSPKSRLLHELEYIWNTEWSAMKNVKLIVCGSAASWMLDKIVNAKGGLHNRLTQMLHLQPFSLQQAEEFLHKRGVKYSQKQVLETYLTTGGVPLYLEMVKSGLSVNQNIQAMCFSKDGYLHDEFNRIFAALFSKSHVHQRLIEVIASKSSGLSRNELKQKAKIELGGRLTHYLNELEAAGFIKCFTPYGNVSREKYYRVIDEYSLFYLRWIKPVQDNDIALTNSHWLDQSRTQNWAVWAGYAFEMTCLKHFNQIRKALGIEHIPCRVGAWRFVPPKGSSQQGAQIDLLFDRDDGVISICEIKYTTKQFVIDRHYAMALGQKADVLTSHLKTDKQVMTHFVSAAGVKENAWSTEIVSSVVMLAGLFG